MSDKTIRIKVTAQTDQAQQELNKLKKSADAALDSGRSKGKGGGFISSMHEIVVTSQVATGAIDKFITGGIRYNALMQNLPFGIDAAAKSTEGFISRIKLMDAAILADRAGIVKSSESFAQFARDVQKVAQTRGQDASEAIDVLTSALARNETKLLDNYGVILKVEQAQEIYAKQLGKTKNDLTDTERQQAFATVGMQKLHEVAEQATTQIDSFDAAFLRLKATLEDVPSLLQSSREWLYNFLDATDGVTDSMERALSGTEGLIGDHRRGVGFKGLADAAQEAADKMFVAREAAGGGTIGALTKWIANEQARGEAIAELTVGKKGYLTKQLDDATNAHFGFNQQLKKGRDLLKEQRELAEYNYKLWKQQDEAAQRFFENFKELRAASVQSRLVPRTNTSTGLIDDPFARDKVADKQNLDEYLNAIRSKEALVTEIEVSGKQLRLDQELSLIEQEKRAELDRIDFLERTAEDESQIYEQRARREEVLHAARLARIDAIGRAEQRSRDRMQKIGESVINVYSGVAGAALSAAISGGQSARESVRHFAAGQALEMGITATTELIRAGVAAASFNYPKAAQHLANAAAAGGEAALLGAVYGVTTGITASPSSGGFGQKNFSLPDDATGSTGSGRVPQTSQSRSGSIRPGAILSRPDAAVHGSQAHGGPAGVSVSLTINSLAEPDADALILRLRRELQRHAYENGAVH